MIDWESQRLELIEHILELPGWAGNAYSRGALEHYCEMTRDLWPTLREDVLAAHKERTNGSDAAKAAERGDGSGVSARR